MTGGGTEDALLEVEDLLGEEGLGRTLELDHLDSES